MGHQKQKETLLKGDWRDVNKVEKGLHNITTLMDLHKQWSLTLKVTYEEKPALKC